LRTPAPVKALNFVSSRFRFGTVARCSSIDYHSVLLSGERGWLCTSYVAIEVTRRKELRWRACQSNLTLSAPSCALTPIFLFLHPDILIFSLAPLYGVSLPPFLPTSIVFRSSSPPALCCVHVALSSGLLTVVADAGVGVAPCPYAELPNSSTL
jgi:hypothetical protein